MQCEWKTYSHGDAERCACREKPGPAEHGDGALVSDHHADPLLIEFFLSMLAVEMKSFSCSPLIFLVLSETVA